MSAKTKWVKFTMMAYATVVVEVPEDEDREMKDYADEMAFHGCLSPGYQLEDTMDFEVLEYEPNDKFCLNNNIDKTPMSKRELEELEKKQAEGGSK